MAASKACGGLPEVTTAAADPAVAAEIVTVLVRESLKPEWREQHANEIVLDRLANLLDLHLEGLAGSSVELNQDHEAAFAACLKLARNLCAGNPGVQEHWRRRGIVERLAQRVRLDLVLPGEGRSTAWRDAVPGFLANVVAGHSELRTHTLLTFFPYGLAGVFALCWHKPQLAFVLVQNLFNPGGGDTCVDGLPEDAPLRRLLSEVEGHILLLMLLSLLWGAPEGSEQAHEWASLMFHALWKRGGFARAYRGVRRLSPSEVHGFLAQVAAGATPASAEGAAMSLAQVAARMCHRSEACGLLWHTVHGLLAGVAKNEVSQEEDGGSAAALGATFLADAGFIQVLCGELSEANEEVARTHNLEWRPREASEEACRELRVMPEDVNVFCLAKAPGERNAGEATAAQPENGGSTLQDDDAVWGKGGTGAYAELMQAVLELTTLPRGPGVDLPGKLVGVALLGSTSLVDALHRRRFGDLARGENPKRESAPEAVAISRDCLLLEHIRLCSNIVYEQRRAQDFLRQIDGLRTLLSHCYADHDLPMLRECAVFSVRNATKGNLENQKAAGELLSQRKQSAETDSSAAMPPAVSEFGFGV